MAYTAEEIADIRAAYAANEELPPAVKTAIAGLGDDIVTALFNTSESQAVKEARLARAKLGRSFREVLQAMYALDENIEIVNTRAQAQLGRQVFSNAQINWHRTTTWTYYNNAVLPEGVTLQEPPFDDPGA